MIGRIQDLVHLPIPLEDEFVYPPNLVSGISSQLVPFYFASDVGLYSSLSFEQYLQRIHLPICSASNRTDLKDVRLACWQHMLLKLHI